jgi:hypothetical protein
MNFMYSYSISLKLGLVIWNQELTKKRVLEFKGIFKTNSYMSQGQKNLELYFKSEVMASIFT